MVATALCADRLSAATPAALQPQVTEMAGRIVSRLQSTFRRTVSPVRIYQPREERDTQRAATHLLIDLTLDIAPRPTSPFQFRLPPPTA